MYEGRNTKNTTNGALFSEVNIPLAGIFVGVSARGEVRGRPVESQEASVASQLIRKPRTLLIPDWSALFAQDTKHAREVGEFCRRRFSRFTAPSAQIVRAKTSYK